MESRAIYKYVRISPRKARRVTTLIKGKKAAEALVFIKFMPYRGAHFVAKVLKSAMANAEQKGENVDVDNMKIKSALVDQGPVMKRMETRSMGRANVIRKRTSHITIVLSEE